MRCRNSRFRLIRRFVQKEDGAATIEAVLWLPFFLALFGLLADVSMIFHGQSKLLRIVQDANRNMSIGRLKTHDEVIDFIETRAGAFTSAPSASSTTAAGLITTSVSVPVTDLDMFGVGGLFKGVNMTVWSEHLMEN